MTMTTVQVETYTVGLGAALYKAFPISYKIREHAQALADELNEEITSGRMKLPAGDEDKRYAVFTAIAASSLSIDDTGTLDEILTTLGDTTAIQVYLVPDPAPANAKRLTALTAPQIREVRAKYGS